MFSIETHCSIRPQTFQVNNLAVINGASSLQRCQAVGYVTLAAVAKCAGTHAWLDAHRNHLQVLLQNTDHIFPYFLPKYEVFALQRDSSHFDLGRLCPGKSESDLRKYRYLFPLSSHVTSTLYQYFPIFTIFHA